MTILRLDTPKRVHVIGIGGSGMGPIATVLAAMGHTVSGSDIKGSPVIDRLRAAGIRVEIGHRAENIGPDVEAVTASTAIPRTNPEIIEAGRRGVPVYRRAETLAGICATRRTIAVAGTHGKTTTSAMLALVLTEVGLAPSFIVGGELPGIGPGAVWADGEWLVVEADESDGTFLELGAEVAIVTSVEPDHLENWGGWEQLRAAFGRFLDDVPGLRLVCSDDEDAAALGADVGAVSYGTADTSTYRIVEAVAARASIRFAIERRGERLGSVDLPVPGIYNARNAAAAVVTAVELGASFDDAARALGRYAGVARRFQLRGERDGVTYIDDYAHLPSEIRSSLAAAREGNWGRVVCVFQPHRYSRMATLRMEDFADAFNDADVLVLTEIYAQGETPRPGVTGKRVLDAVLDAHPGRKSYWFPTRGDLANNMRGVLRPGDLCLTLGAGDLTLLPSELLDESE